MATLKQFVLSEDQFIETKNKKAIKFEKEMRLLAKSSALMLGAMTPRSRNIVFESFEKIDLYDNDLVQAFKRCKLIK